MIPKASEKIGFGLVCSVNVGSWIRADGKGEIAGIVFVGVSPT